MNWMDTIRSPFDRLNSSINKEVGRLGMDQAQTSACWTEGLPL